MPEMRQLVLPNVQTALETLEYKKKLETLKRPKMLAPARTYVPAPASINNVNQSR